MVTDHNNTIGFQRFHGRIPWTDIGENPSDHLASKSRPDSDCRLGEPSHMKSDSIDCWLTHWLKLQNRGKRPLIVKDPAAVSSPPRPKPTMISKRKVKRSNAQDTDNLDPDGSSGRERSETSGTGVMVDGDGSVGTSRSARDATGGDSNSLENVHMVDEGGIDRSALASDSYHAGGASHGTVSPASPLSACYNRNTRRQFLESLSSDPNYLNLLNLLDRACVSNELMSPSSSDTFPGW